MDVGLSQDLSIEQLRQLGVLLTTHRRPSRYMINIIISYMLIKHLKICGQNFMPN